MTLMERVWREGLAEVSGPVSVTSGEQVGAEQPGEKDWEILVAEKLDMSQQRALTAQRAKSLLGCGMRSGASRSRERMVPDSAPLSWDPTWNAVSSSGVHSTSAQTY